MLVSSLLMYTGKSLVRFNGVLSVRRDFAVSAILVSGARDGLVVVWDTRYNNRGVN